MGKTDEALDDFDYLIQNDPYNPSYITDRAIVLHLMKRNEESIAELDKAVNLDPNNPYRYSSRAFIKDRLGELNGAILDYEKAIELDPEDAIAYNNLGILLEKSGNKERAKKNYQISDNLTEKSAGNPNLEYSTNNVSEVKLEENNGKNYNYKANQKNEKNVTFFDYLTILKSVFFESAIRKDFILFLKSKIFKS
jgi:tetratricopeptide (TPR) repeat protein